MLRLLIITSVRLTADTLRQLQGNTEREETPGERERVDTIMKMIDNLEEEIQAGPITKYRPLNISVLGNRS